jgi:regulator of sigma E protease
MNVLLGFVAFWIAFGIGVPSAVEEGNTPPPNARVVVSQVLPGGPADMAGVRVGDILANLESPTALADLVSANPGGVQLEVARGDEVFSIALTPAPNIIPDEPEKLAVGIGSLLVANESFGFFESLVRAIEATGTGLVSIVLGFASLIAGVFTSGASLESLAGPVGIAGLVGDAATFGIGQVLILTAVISLNLAVLNLLPFPALDGGRLLFLMIEVVRGRAISPRVAGAVNAGGFALLILLMLVVTWNDIENF